MFNARILVVEDNAILQRVIALLAAKYGVDADIVANGQDALSALSRYQDYSLIFMDWKMPEMDGIECTKAIRGNEQSLGRHIPIVAMTANADDKDKQACLSSGMDDYMSKPFKAEDFRDILRRFIPQRLAEQAPQKIPL